MGYAANLYAREGTIDGDETIEFPIRATHIEIINDNSSGTLKYKFNETEQYATLKPLEAVVTNTRSWKLYLRGTGEYRVRGEG